MQGQAGGGGEGGAGVEPIVVYRLGPVAEHEITGQPLQVDVPLGLGGMEPSRQGLVLFRGEGGQFSGPGME